jgi:predicted transcriptional regulator
MDVTFFKLADKPAFAKGIMPRQPRPMPSATQLRAARAMLRWSIEEVATRAKMSTRTVIRAEEDAQPVSVRSLRRLTSVFEAEGIEFLGANSVRGTGVRFRNPNR